MIEILEILIIGGFLGSGKTTTLINIGKYYTSIKKKKVAIIVNEIGDIGIDGDIINQYGFNSKEITSGCICCSLKVSLKSTIFTLIEEYNPDILIIEPTGIALPLQIKNEIILMDIKISYKLLPLVVLVDCSRFKQLIKELKRFFIQHLDGAELIVLNKIDLINKFELKLVEESCIQINKKSKVCYLSNKNKDLISNLIFMIENTNIIIEDNDRNIKLIDSDNNLSTFIDNNSILLSDALSFSIKYLLFDISHSIIKEVLFEIVNELKSIIINIKINFVGHIKAYINDADKTYKVSIISNFQVPLYEEFINNNSNNYLKNNSNIYTFKLMIAISNIKSKISVNLFNNNLKDKINNIFNKYNINFKEY